MSNLSPELYWQELSELDHRTTPYGLDLTLRDVPSEDQLGILAMDAEGVTEIIMDTSAALEAYSHPSVTPGLETAQSEINPWDVALDSINGLPERVRTATMEDVKRVARGKRIGPVVLLTAAEVQIALHRSQLQG
ncbi:MAG TPA: hypothetical protein VEH48_00230 [Candidatus Nitrosopolaris sp.]|nr:hypothetical protein [Candidatus Nitrosopolaris sp.]